MMRPEIPQTDPHAGYLALKDEIDSACRRVMDSGRYILAGEVESFEREFAEYLGVADAVGVASGTDALYLALRACGVGAGDEVITVSHTAVATVAAIVQAGATPVFVDINAETYCMDSAGLANAVCDATRAIMPVHLYGLPADMSAIMPFARKHGLKVVEDCAQAHGAEVSCPGQTERVGSFGDAAAFSFYPTKNLGAFGDGGCVVTNSPEVAEKVRLLRQYGWRERYVSSCHGWNSRLDELQAAILRVRLKRLEADNAERWAIAAVYDEGLGGSEIVRPVRPDDRRHVFHQYVVRVPERDILRHRLSEADIGTAIHYPVPVHLQPAYRHLAEPGSLPITESVCEGILSLPMYPQLGKDDARYVVESILRAASEMRPYCARPVAI